MAQVSVSIGCVTLVVGAELIHVAVDSSRLPPSSIRPSLHPGGLQAKHLTIPLKPLRHGPHAGTYWFHLKYPDGTHGSIAYLTKEQLRTWGAMLESGLQKIIFEQALSGATEIDPAWLSCRDYKLMFADEQDFPAWADAHFGQKPHRYRVSLARLERAAGEFWIAEPEILDDSSFAENPPRCLQAFSSTQGNESLAVWHFPWGPDGSFRWYAAPMKSLMPDDRAFFELIVRPMPYAFWEGIRLILIELGIPADYQRLDELLAAVKAGQFERVEEFRRRALSAA